MITEENVHSPKGLVWSVGEGLRELLGSFNFAWLEQLNVISCGIHQ
jgi:hypothetical protein